MEESKWFGLKFNFRWPHEGICFGLSIDLYDWEEKTPWSSVVFRVLFLTVIYDYGWGDDSRKMYNSQ
tara:strand:+ start:108 stop:308 length:201 start_codon:yes stop_codon:yes gene_type:complete